jgi:hypothetical protein
MLQLDLNIQSLDLQTNADRFRHKLIDKLMKIQVSNKHRLFNLDIIKRHKIRRVHYSDKHILKKIQNLDINSQIV